LLSRTAKFFGVCQQKAKATLCSVQQSKSQTLEFSKKTPPIDCLLVQPHTEKFWNLQSKITQLTVFGSSEIFWNLPQRAAPIN
jgi:hypothetical protein